MKNVEHSTFVGPLKGKNNVIFDAIEKTAADTELVIVERNRLREEKMKQREQKLIDSLPRDYVESLKESYEEEPNIDESMEYVYFASGKIEIRKKPVYEPINMSLYGISRSIVHGDFSRIKKNEYKKVFFYKISHLLIKYLGKYDNDTKKKFVELLFENLYLTLSYTLKGIEDYEYDTSISHRERKDTNKLLFGSRIEKRFINLLKSEHVLGVIKDRDLVEGYKQGEVSFKEIETIYKGQLKNFSYGKKVQKEDSDDMYQEGLLVLLNVINHYDGYYYTRLHTYLKRSLQNKYTDLIRASRRQKRVINTFAKPYSTQAGDSELTVEVDRLTYKHWETDISDRNTIEEALCLSDTVNEIIGTTYSYLTRDGYEYLPPGAEFNKNGEWRNEDIPF